MASKKSPHHFKFVQYVKDTPIVPIRIRILLVFIFFILLAGFSTNLIALLLMQSKVVDLTNKLLVNKLSDVYTTAGNQFQIQIYSGERDEAVDAIRLSAINSFDMSQSLALGVNEDGSLLFCACADASQIWEGFKNEALLDALLSSDGQGTLNFSSPTGIEYHGVFKYQDDWKMYLIRAESIADTNNSMYRVLIIISLAIILVTIVCLVFGAGILSRLLSNISRFTTEMYDMQQTQDLKEIDISNSPNDDITYLAANFNLLSSRVNYLLDTFQKFVPEAVIKRARKEMNINLRQGGPLELTILFSDIRSFTYRTEVLGTDIIDLLNVHYNSVINRVKVRNGEIGSIIGDAILASYGHDDSVKSNKSYDAIASAWDITTVTYRLRSSIENVRQNRIAENKPLTLEEQKVLDAALLDVGVGIDGGVVYYGNVGSENRMQSTFIGDNVNSASRLEGLTRIYRVPVIVSEYVKNEAIKDSRTNENFEFYELDTVLVKGKTEGVKIYIPLCKKKVLIDGAEPNPDWAYENVKSKFEVFKKALDLYYKGDWKEARVLFKESELSVGQEFIDRIGKKNAPENWSGIWTMTSK